MEDGINNGLADSRVEVMYLAEGRGRDMWLQKVRILTLRLCTQAVLTKLERKRHRWSSMSFHRYRIGKHIINIYHHGLTRYSQNTKFKRRENEQMLETLSELNALWKINIKSTGSCWRRCTGRIDYLVLRKKKRCHLVHIVDWITGYKDKEILDKGTMIAHTLSKAIRDEKDAMPSSQENFADMEFKKMCSMMDRW